MSIFSSKGGDSICADYFGDEVGLPLPSSLKMKMESSTQKKMKTVEDHPRSFLTAMKEEKNNNDQAYNSPAAASHFRSRQRSPLDSIVLKLASLSEFEFFLMFNRY
ncbi:hypothetical protein BVC80_1719g92 [Macleaya cordata]|uniref:Uncharacterized protein n=1 Tax=Macleaya cordata TaxID=56857 RepID=A0A200Q2W4_MACCD|nr:hypothetical protein BVC80_1719g92 [Macleaya cordata]